MPNLPVMKLAMLALAALQGADAFVAGMGRAVWPFSTSSPAVRMQQNQWLKEITPDSSLAQKIESLTRKTWQFNDAKRNLVQVAVVSEGRPINADFELWIGPDWTPFSLKAYSENGQVRPIQTLIGTRNQAAMLAIRNVGDSEFPFTAAANYAGEALQQGLEEALSAPKQRKQNVDGAGSIKFHTVDADTSQAELVLMTDGRQLNAKVELLNAPNNAKQTVEVFTNNGLLNALYLRFDTPDAGDVIRVINQAPVEFPFKMYVNEIGGGAPVAEAPAVEAAEEEAPAIKPSKD